MGFFEKISAGLKKTRDSLMGRLEDLAAGFTKVDEDFFDELEETLIMGDVGANVTMRIMDELGTGYAMPASPSPLRSSDSCGRSSPA